MIADLYIRVSTDEQADKGYSQRYQEEVLRKYCEANRVTIRNVIYEDHSAKTFNRPQWKKFLLGLRKSKRPIERVLFTKWDRFSRNAGDAYQMITTLRKLGCEPQAIEQPLDLGIPENKIMLAFYLAAPEVENDRRALNVSAGIRRAKKEGRYFGKAPFGYANKCSEDGRKYIAPREPQAATIRWIFSELSRGVFSTEHIWRESAKKGFNKKLVNFWQLIRNPVYCGRIIVPACKDEPETVVKGLHEAIITEALFYRVQDVLDGRGRHYRVRTLVDADIPLRGFLTCPRCGAKLSGSASKGRHQHYWYYHCTASCGCRFSARKVNEEMIREIRKYVPYPAVVKLYTDIILEKHRARNSAANQELQNYKAELAQVNADIARARKLLLAEAIDPSDYRQIKAECEDRLARVEAHISELTETCSSHGLKSLLDLATDSIANMADLFARGDVYYKRQLISILFPENLEFDGARFRTALLNEVIAGLFSLSAGLEKKKSVENGQKTMIYAEEVSSGFEPL